MKAYIKTTLLCGECQFDLYGPVSITTVAGIKTLAVYCANRKCAEYQLAYFLPSVELTRIRRADSGEMVTERKQHGTD